MLDHEFEHVSSISPQRHADADLVGALGDGVRHHAVNPHDGQRQRDDGQSGEQQSVEAWSCDGAPSQIFHRLDVAYRHIWVNRVDLAHDGLGRARRLDGRARHDVVGNRTPTVTWPINGRLDFAVKVGGFDVSHDADNLIPGFHPVEFDAAAQRVFVGPETPGHRFIDDGHSVRLDNLTFCEISAHQNRDTHRLEEVGVDQTVVNSGPARYIHIGIAIEQDWHNGVAQARPLEWQNVDGARLLHSGSGFYSLDRLSEKLRCFPSKITRADLSGVIVFA